MNNIIVHKNKGEVFKCQFKIDGAEIKDTIVRLCLEFDNNKNMFFYGDLHENGECVIEIPELRELKEKEGKLTVEAIADSVYFKLYEANVEFKNSVEVSMDSPTTKQSTPKMEVKMEGLTQEVKPKKVIKEQVKPKIKEQEKTDDWAPLKKETKTYEKEEVEEAAQEASDNKLKSFQDYLNLKK